MIRVAIIFDNFGPYHIARLQAAANELNLVAIEVAGTSATYAWDNDAKAVRFQRITLVDKGTSGDVSRAELSRRLERALNEAKPGVVIVPGWASTAAWSAMTWCLRRGVPMVCMSESTVWDEPRSAWKEWVKRKLVGLFSSALVGGERHRDYLVTLGMRSDRIFFGYDAVDNAYFFREANAVRANAEAMRRQHDLPENYFLASARFIEKKNLPRLLEAYALYRKSVQKPWSLVLLGDGHLRAELESKREALGLRDYIVMPGFKQLGDLPAYYALSGAFIHPSTIEPWGLVVNEALASGLPVLVSDRCGCAPELVKENENGFTFDPLDAGQMAGLMARIAAPDFPRAAYGKKSSEIIANWCPDRFASGLAQAIDAALHAPPVHPTATQKLLLRLVQKR